MKIIYSNHYKDMPTEDEIKKYLEESMENSKITTEMIKQEIELQDEMNVHSLRINLDIQIPNRILIISSLGLWNGRTPGYSFIDSGNIKDIFYSDCTICKWYIEKNNVRSTQIHHDGTNYLEYREIRNENNINTLLDKIYEGKKISRSLLNYYTKNIAKPIKKVFGW